jgi:hypothetical protein
MAVPREELDGRRLGRPVLSVVAEQATRQESGAWSVTVALAGRVTLPDGRVLVFDRTFPVAARQKGRKNTRRAKR